MIRKTAATRTGDSARILLVTPEYPSGWGHILPVGLGYLAEQLELHSIDYDVVDVSIEGEGGLFAKLEKLRPEYVAFSLMSLDVFHNYGLITRVKAACPQVKIIAGGPHLSFVKEKAFGECSSIDFGITHEGEHALLELLNAKDYEAVRGLIFRREGAVVYTGDRPLFANLDELRFPRYKKFQLSKYGRTMSLISSRGCPFSCTFCGAHLSMGRKWRSRSVASLLEELRYWHELGYREFTFVDSNFFFSNERVSLLCDKLEEERLNITINSDGMRAKDAELEMLKKVKRIGLRSVAIGIESANEDILRTIKKGETLEEIEQGIRLLASLDIGVTAFFIIGLPGETVTHVMRSLLFPLRFSNISRAYYFHLNPLLGTDIYKWARERHYLKATDEQIYENIGGMGPRVLVETPELSGLQRRMLHRASWFVSKLVAVRGRLRRAGGRLVRRGAREAMP